MAFVGVERAVRQILQDDADVFALVGARVNPAKAEQGPATPYVVYQMIANEHHEMFGGSAGLANALIQISGFSTSKSEVLDLREKVRLALQGQTSVVTVGADTFDVRSIHLEGDRDIDDDPRDGSDAAIYGWAMDFRVGYPEPVP
ncbi:hypothetical protein LCGC14_0323440 [marine sediment metagenome]|uniref:Uncharacterized protein n=1 Tax=marine sediment metagenome TaxID=412755 RepID=A0A0F9TIN0_9ZZZZ